MNPIGVTGDTLINNKTYIKIGQSMDTTFNDINNTINICAIRELNDQYLIVQAGDTTEYILNDFSASIGDTVAVFNLFNGQEFVKVISVDSIPIQGQYRKRMNLEALFFPMLTNESWIEGIGSTYGLIYPAVQVTDVAFELMCFHENDTTVYNVSPTGNCRYSLVGTDDLESGAKEIVRIVDLMGRECEDVPNTPLIYIYSDGSTKKVFRMK